MDLPGIRFTEDAQGRLIVDFAPPQGAGPLSLDAGALREHAGTKVHGDLQFDLKSIEALVAKMRRGEACSGQIAQRTDAKYRVEVAANRLTAWLTVIAACGGKPANAADALAALAELNVREGIDAAAVDTAVEQCGVRQEVARGRPPQAGSDAMLEPLIAVNRQRHPQVNASGQVDFHDLGAIPTVNAGDPIMRRHPPQPGVPGCNVLGESVDAQAGKDCKFAVRLQGVVASPHDPNLLLAEIAGQPVLQRDGITVEPIVRYQEIDLAAGNIDFPGSIEVKGDIRSGMKVRAAGDITVSGVIESAEVSAGGDVKVQGGIIGHSPLQHTEQSSTSQTARIAAGGSISARFVENAVIEAQHAVQIAESVVQSDVTALDQVVVGSKGKKGRVLGGIVRATVLVSADLMGGEGSGPTRVMVGVNPLLQRAIDEHRQRLAAKLKEHDDVSKVMTLLKGRPDKQPIFDKARLTLMKISEEIAAEMDKERVLNAEAKLADSAKIVIGEQIASGVTVVVGRKSRFVSEDLGRGVFHLDESGDLGYGTLAR